MYKERSQKSLSLRANIYRCAHHRERYSFLYMYATSHL